VAIPLLIVLILFANQFFFNIIIFLLALWGLFEFFRMSLPKERRLEKHLAVLGGAFLVFLPDLQGTGFQFGLPTFLFLLFAMLFLFRCREITTVAAQLSLIFLGFAYIPLLLGHVGLLFELPHGREWIFLVLLVVMCSDSLAYFVGTSLGHHKLYPAISPKKSIEGSLGGLAGSLLAAYLARMFFCPFLSAGDCVLLGLLLGVLGQVGDLFESMLKRSFGVKDSGTLVPGHGGILDRLDSLLFAFPAAYYYATLIL
jgi:phosphatidate cytidylyltransferase